MLMTQSPPKTLEEALEIIGALVKELAILREENYRLKEQLNINSKNSSLPPSRDLKKKGFYRKNNSRREMEKCWASLCRESIKLIKDGV